MVTNNPIHHQVADFMTDTVDMKQLIDINQIVTEAIQLLHTQIEKRTHNFHLELEKKLPHMMGNFTKIEQVVINLLQNAILALAKPGCAVTVKTGYLEPENKIVIEITDEGVGIPEQDLKFIKEPFFTTRRARGGVGLGNNVPIYDLLQDGSCAKMHE